MSGTDLGALLHTADVVTCSACKSVYSDPQLLACLHSVCRHCVQTEKGSNHDLQCVQCQTKVKDQTYCSETNGHALLMDNPFLKSLVELHQCHTTADTQPCDYCSYDNQTVTSCSRCLQCHDNLCRACAEAHRRTKLTRHHTLATLEEMRSGRQDTAVRACQGVACQAHLSETIKYLCRKCERLICRECKVSEHEKHSCFDLQEACDRFKNKTTPILDRVREKWANLEQYLKFMDGYNKYVSDNSASVVQQIQAHAQKLHSMVDEYQNSTIAKIQSAAKEEQELLADRSAAASQVVSTLASSCRYVDTLLTHGNDDEILYSRQLVTDRLSQLLHLQPDSLTKTLNQYFRSGAATAKNMEALFGKADSFHQSLNEQNVKAICDDMSITISSALPMLRDHVTLVLEFTAKGVSDIRDIWPTGIAINRSGHMFIVDRKNKRVKLYDAAGKFEYEFGQTGAGQLNCPYDITVLKNGNVAVTDYNDEDVKIFTSAGEFVTRWKQGFKYARGISTNSNNQVIVVDVNSHQVTLHHPDTGALEQTIGGKLANGCLMFTDPYYVSTSNQNYILVTDWGSPNIKVFDKSGVMRQDFITYGVGKDRMLQPHGICTDSYGYIFIADNQNHRIHLLAPDGHFKRFLLTEEHGLWHPMALSINPKGHLVVTEALGKVKVFKYM